MTGTGISGRLGINFGSGAGRAAKGQPQPFGASSGAQPSDHSTLIVLVLAEALFVGWLRFTFKKRFGG